MEMTWRRYSDFSPNARCLAVVVARTLTVHFKTPTRPLRWVSAP